jgi:hypothetical protein
MSKGRDLLFPGEINYWVFANTQKSGTTQWEIFAGFFSFFFFLNYEDSHSYRATAKNSIKRRKYASPTRYSLVKGERIIRSAEKAALLSALGLVSYALRIEV